MTRVFPELWPFLKIRFLPENPIISGSLWFSESLGYSGTRQWCLKAPWFMNYPTLWQDFRVFHVCHREMSDSGRVHRKPDYSPAPEWQSIHTGERIQKGLHPADFRGYRPEKPRSRSCARDDLRIFGTILEGSDFLRISQEHWRRWIKTTNISEDPFVSPSLISISRLPIHMLEYYSKCSYSIMTRNRIYKLKPPKSEMCSINPIGSQLYSLGLSR
jgi:hypothetical protein